MDCFLPRCLIDIVDSYCKPKRHYTCVRKVKLQHGGIWVEEKSGWLTVEPHRMYMNARDVYGKVLSHANSYHSFVIHQAVEKKLVVMTWNALEHHTDYVIDDEHQPEFLNGVLYVPKMEGKYLHCSNHGTFLMPFQNNLYEISLIDKTVTLVYEAKQNILRASGWNKTYFIRESSCVILDSSGNCHRVGSVDDFQLEDDLVVCLQSSTITWYDACNNWKPIVKQMEEKVKYVYVKDRYTYVLLENKVEIWTHEPSVTLHTTIDLHGYVYTIQPHSLGFIAFSVEGALFYQ